MGEPSWKLRGACRDASPSIFYPDLGSGAREVKEAKKLCEGCPVRGDCLQAGMHERFGIWGGLTERERRRLKLRMGHRRY